MNTLRALLAEGDQVALIEGDPQVATHLSETLEGPVLVIQGVGVRLHAKRMRAFLMPTSSLLPLVTTKTTCFCEIANRVFGISRALARVNDPRTCASSAVWVSRAFHPQRLSHA